MIRFRRVACTRDTQTSKDLRWGGLEVAGERETPFLADFFEGHSNVRRGIVEIHVPVQHLGVPLEVEVFEERLDKVCIACENDAVGTNSDIETRGRVDEDLLELGHVANANGDVETLGGEAGLGEDLVELLDRGDLHLVHVGLRVKPAMKESNAEDESTIERAWSVRIT